MTSPWSTGSGEARADARVSGVTLIGRNCSRAHLALFALLLANSEFMLFAVL